MPLSHLVAAGQYEHHLPLPPMVIGLLIFAFFCVLMMALLMFGKGRPHS